MKSSVSVFVLLLMTLSCVCSHSPETNNVPSLHPVQRGSGFPLILEHTGVAEAGAGAELQTRTKDGISMSDIDIRKRR